MIVNFVAIHLQRSPTDRNRSEREPFSAFNRTQNPGRPDLVGCVDGRLLVDSVTRLCAMNLLLHDIGETACSGAVSAPSKLAVADHRYNCHQRTERARFKSFIYDELLKRDKVNRDIFWLKNEALEESANLPAPEIIAQEIADDLEAALEQFATIAKDLE